MHWSLLGVSHLGLAKLVNCNQIVGHVADQDCIEFIDSKRVLSHSSFSEIRILLCFEVVWFDFIFMF